jgi:sortase (surface protein transpeptidase)
VWAATAAAVGAVLIAVAVLGLVAIAVFGFGANGGAAPGSTARMFTPAQVADPRTDTLDLDRRLGSPDPVTTTTTPTPTPTTIPAAPALSTGFPTSPPAVTPAVVRIPSVGISSQLIRLGLNPDNTIEVPKNFALAGWYIYRAVPGEPGPSIIAGHIDSKSGPAVFYRLKDVSAGAIVEVERTDGSTAVFTVTGKEQHSKNAFPTEQVYGPTASPELRLITCGGSFNRSTGHYTDNTIVFAKLAQIVPPH